MISDDAMTDLFRIGVAALEREDGIFVNGMRSAHEKMSVLYSNRPHGISTLGEGPLAYTVFRALHESGYPARWRVELDWGTPYSKTDRHKREVPMSIVGRSAGGSRDLLACIEADWWDDFKSSASTISRMCRRYPETTIRKFMMLFFRDRWQRREDDVRQGLHGTLDRATPWLENFQAEIQIADRSPERGRLWVVLAEVVSGR
jgi:hypothetical protein